MRILCVGGGPASLYFALLMKKADPRHDVTVVERNPAGQTFGWGVVFSDETLGNLEDSDAESYRRIVDSFVRWDAIDIHYRGEVVRSSGHGFSGLGRVRLLDILQTRCRELGVRLEFDTEIADFRAYPDHDLVFAADGVKSRVRESQAAVFKPSIELGACRYIWLGTDLPLGSFTFLFERGEHGWFTVHAYRYDAGMSTFIVETSEETWLAAGLDRATVPESLAYLERLFAPHLRGHRLRENRSSWIRFPTVRCETWHHENVVLAGDAAHTAHFSIGSGTKLAMEDAMALARAFAGTTDVKRAIEAYEEERRPVLARTQKAAEDSRTWFENVKRYAHFEPLPFAFSLLTRSKRVSYENLRLRDPGMVERLTEWYARKSGAAPAVELTEPGSAEGVAAPPPPPPMFTPFRLRHMPLVNRVALSPMAMYSAVDGTPTDFHLVHLGSRALGGAGLVFTEMTHVSREARITPGCTGMYRPEHVIAWRRIVEFVHDNTEARICLQVGHAGRKGSTRLMWQGIDEPLPEGNWPLLSASPIPFLPHSQVPREMDRDDMRWVTAEFARAARMADEAGFDMIELHMAHGYLLASFLSPLTNVRRDEYGGPLENRLRWPLEVFDAVRAAWPAAKPISVRISATDWLPGGFTGEDAVAAALALKDHGVDVLHLSTGLTTHASRPAFYGRMFQTQFSDQVRNEAHVPTIAVGNITSADQVNSILAAGRADLVAIGRPLLNDPYWTLHAATEQGFLEQPWPNPYLAGRPRPADPGPARGGRR